MSVSPKRRECIERALAGLEKARGVDHSSTLNTVNNFGLLYIAQGRLADGERMYERALAGYEEALGADHSSTLDTVHNLGFLYVTQGHPADAENMYKRALTGRERYWDETITPPSTLLLPILETSTEVRGVQIWRILRCTTTLLMKVYPTAYILFALGTRLF